MYIKKRTFIYFVVFIFLIWAQLLNCYAENNIRSKNELLYTVKQYIKMAEVLDRNDKKRVEYFKQASELSQELIHYYPDEEMGYAYLAYSLGSITREIPFYKKISAAKTIKTSIDKSLALNEKNHLAWFVAGMFYREAAKIDGFQRKLAEKYLNNIIEGASFEKAINCFEKAIELDTGNIQYRYELAKTYEDFGKTALALAEYKKILTVQANEKKDIIYQHKAEKQLKKIS